MNFKFIIKNLGKQLKIGSVTTVKFMPVETTLYMVIERPKY